MDHIWKSIADYSVRIENLLRRATLGRSIDASVQNEMLCAKFWNGLKDLLLKNSCRFMFETEKDFIRLMKYIRSVEQDLSASAAANHLSSASNSTDTKASKYAKTATQSLHATDKLNGLNATVHTSTLCLPSRMGKNI